MRRLLTVLLIVVVACGAALAWLVGTHSGLAFVLARAEGALSGLSVAHVDGSLAGGVTLTSAAWRSDGLSIAVDGAHLRPALLPLLQGRYEFDAVALAGVRYVQDAGDPAAADDATAEPVVLPTLSVAALVVRDATLAFGDTRVAITRADAALALQGQRITIDALQLDGEPVDATGRVVVDLAAAFPLAELDLVLAHATADGRTWRGRATRAAGAGAGGGDTLRVELTEPLAGTAVAAIGGDGRIGMVDVSIPDQDGAAIGVPGTLGAALTLRIDGARVEPAGRLTIAGQPMALAGGQLDVGDAALAIAALAVDIEERGRIVIDGQLPFAADAPLALVLATDAFDIDAADGRRVRAAGRIELAGTQRRPRITPTLTLTSAGWPDGRLGGSVDIDADGARLEGLVLDAAGGRVRVDGVYAWAGDSALRVSVAGFDPALLAADWPGQVDAEFVVAGRVVDGLPEARIYLVSLGGRLRDAALSGGGELAWAGREPGAGRLSVAWGAARVRADLDAAQDGEIDVSLPDLGQVLPGSRGRVDVEWRRGEDEHIVANVTGLVHAGTELDTVTLDARRARDRAGAFTLELGIAGGRQGAVVLEQATLTATGREQDHAIELDLRLADGVSLDARAEGGYVDGSWSGRLVRAELDGLGARAGLAQPVQLVVAADRVLLDDACWTIASGEACVRAAGDATNATFAARLSGLSLAALRKLAAGIELPELEGLVDGDASVELRDGRIASATLALASPRGIAVLPGRDDLDLGYRRLDVDARYADGTGSVNASAELVPQGRIDLAAIIDQDEAGNLGWDATLAVAITDLSFIEAFTTAIAEPVGDLRGQFRFQGGWRPQSISGAVAITGFTALAPAQAIRLRDGVLAVAGVPGQLVVRGSVRSGDGTLTIDGRIIPADPVPALLTIRGDGVRFANTPTLMVIASPDLELKLTDGRWNLDGTIAVPRARIDASKIEAGAEASPDVIVVDDTAAGAPARPWRARVRVSLGDDVKLEAFGFNGTVAGALDIRQRQGAQALATGEITLAGRYEAYGQRLTITRGGLRYANSPLAEPAVDLRAERKVRDQTVALEVTGSALAPQSRIVGGNGSDADALALLVTGRPLSEVGIGDRDQLGEAASALGAVGSDLLTRQLRGRLGLDELGVSNDTRLEGEAFTLGKFLSPRLYVGYGIGLVTRGEIFTVRYLVTDRLDIEASSGDAERAAVNWRIER